MTYTRRVYFMRGVHWEIQSLNAHPAQNPPPGGGGCKVVAYLKTILPFSASTRMVLPSGYRPSRIAMLSGSRISC